MNFLPEASNTGGHIAMSFFKRKFPFEYKRFYTYNEWRDFEKRYKKWTWITALVAMFFFFTLPLLWAGLFFYIYKAVFYFLIPKGATFWPIEWLFFAATGLVCTLAMLFIVVEKVQQIFVAGNFDEFEDYYNSTQGYDTHKAGLFVCKVMVPFIIVAAYFNFTTHVYATQEGFVYKGLTDISSKEYKYNELGSLTYYKSSQAKDGTIYSDGRQYKIIMKDGSTIRPGFYFGEADKVAPFVELLHERSGIIIDTQQVLLYKDK
jgi:hypothetical protein